MRTLLFLAAATLLTPPPSARTVDPAVDRAVDHDDVLKAMASFKKQDPSMQKFFDTSVGYAVFPTITKGGIGVGAAHGSGEVFHHGAVIGTASMTQVTVGAQLGGQQYSEIVFFETRDNLKSFEDGNLKFSAQVSAVAAAEGASANAKYQQGVAVFTLAKGGLMYEASVGGQKFSYKPNDQQ